MVSKVLDIHTGSLLPFEPTSRALVLQLMPLAVTVMLYTRQDGLPEAVEVFNGDFSLTDNWQQMAEQSALLNFREVESRLVICLPAMLPIPAGLFTPEAAKEQMALLFGGAEHVFTGGDIVNQYEMVVSWQLPAVVKDWLSNHFKVLQIQHLATSMVAKAVLSEKSEGWLMLSKGIVWIVLASQKKLQLITSFVVEAPEDISYFLLNACRQLNIAVADIYWNITGSLSEDAVWKNAVTDYFPQVTGFAASKRWPKDFPAEVLQHLL